MDHISSTNLVRITHRNEIVPNQYYLLQYRVNGKW